MIIKNSTTYCSPKNLDLVVAYYTNFNMSSLSDSETIRGFLMWAEKYMDTSSHLHVCTVAVIPFHPPPSPIVRRLETVTVQI